MSARGACRPKVSVVIPTYNWSEALRCAIQSVLLQTEQDFEVLVVGDGCTDDSAEIVAAFGDPRLRWHNLARNHGSQWAANNYALETARADWIAYLGHDDIWYPTHLAAILSTAEATGAEIVTSAMILYGPPRTQFRGMAGVFPDGVFRPSYFVPPSAFSHARALYGDVIVWRDPATLVVPMDAAFQNELAAAERRFATTRELTCFKFNAAYRRDSYVTKPVAEQEAMLTRIRCGIDFRHEELVKVVESVVSDRALLLLDLAVAPGSREGEVVARNRRYKGLDPRFDPAHRPRLTGLARFDMAEQGGAPFEWHVLETAADGETYRWSGPSPCATIDLPVAVEGDVEARIKVRGALDDAVLSATRLLVHGHELPVALRREEIDCLVVRIPHAAIDPRRTFGVTLDTGRVVRPCDVTPANDDSRWLGLAIAWIELRPIEAEA